MNKIDSKKIMYYVLLIGILALVVVYFLVYRSYTEKTETLERENTTLSNRVAVLKEYYDNKKMYEEAISAMSVNVLSKLDVYPVDVLEEDAIVLALNTLDDSIVGYTGINIGERVPLYDIDRGIVGQAQIEGLSDNLTLAHRVTQYSNKTDYQNMKSCVASIFKSKNKKSIKSISYTAGDDGLLEGTIEVDFYFVLGTGKQYEPVNLPDYEAGLFDLFGITTIANEEHQGL